jgi:hypothetical protein
MDKDGLIGAYSDLAVEVCGETLNSLPVNIKGDVKMRFDSTRLENAIWKVVEAGGATQLHLFNAGIENGCRT